MDRCLGKVVERALELNAHVLVTADLLDRAPELAAVGAFCIGTEHVDLEACNRRGVVVFNAPFSNTRSVAELVIAELIALARRLAAAALPPGLYQAEVSTPDAPWHPRAVATGFWVKDERLLAVFQQHDGI